MKHIIIQQFTSDFRFLITHELYSQLNLEFGIDTTRDIVFMEVQTIDDIDYMLYSVTDVDFIAHIINRILNSMDETIKELKDESPKYP